MSYNIKVLCLCVHADIILHPQNETVATGQTIVLTCMVYYTGMDDITYQWTKTEEKNVIVPLVAYDSNLTIYDTNVNDTGMYNCIAFSSSSNTSIKSNTASVSVLGEFYVTDRRIFY